MAVAAVLAVLANFSVPRGGGAVAGVTKWPVEAQRRGSGIAKTAR